MGLAGGEGKGRREYQEVESIRGVASMLAEMAG
jgi:hypothetical protein